MSTHRKSAAMSKHDLAAAYSPDMKSTSALRRLERMINSNFHLKRELKGEKYYNTQKTLTFRQLSIIFKYLGTPQTDKIRSLRT